MKLSKYLWIAVVCLAGGAMTRGAEDAAAAANPGTEVHAPKGEPVTGKGTVYRRRLNGVVVSVKLATREFGTVDVVLDEMGLKLAEMDQAEIVGIRADGKLKVQTIVRNWGMFPVPDRAPME